jgi:outer membrane protein assembly factor BamD
MIRLKPALLLCLAGAALVPLSACQTLQGRDRERARVAFVERPVEQLYNEARDKLDDRLWAEAVEGFQEVERQHPYSEWARRSILMGAYGAYMQNKYEEAIGGAQRFIALHPGNVGAPYAYYLIALSYFEQIVDVGRDQRLTELSLAALNEVVQRYPQSEYARDARLKIDMTRDQLAGKEMEIGRYYLRQGQQLAAINRFRRVVELYQTTTHTPEALHRLVEGYLSMGVTPEATQVAAVLGYNYPGSPWYEASYALLTDRGLRPDRPPEGDRDGWFQRTWSGLFGRS